MRGHEQTGSTGRTIAAPLPAVPERLIQRRAEGVVPKSMEQTVAEHLFGSEHGLSEEEVVRCAFVYARAYKDGVESVKGNVEVVK